MPVIILITAMGIRISYYKNDFGKGLKDLIFENFTEFRRWYLNEDKFSTEEFSEPFGSEELKAYFRKETDLVSDFPKLDKQFIDELTSEFIGNYCDLTDQGGKILNFFGPTMSVWRYKESTKMILETKDKAFFNLWSFIVIRGRSLSDNLEFSNYGKEFKIGFLSRPEFEELKSKIEHYFGDLKTIKDKFWTSQEKMKLEKAIENSTNGSYSLSEHNPKSSGLEYVLMAINELNDKNVEIITDIEQGSNEW